MDSLCEKRFLPETAPSSINVLARVLENGTPSSPEYSYEILDGPASTLQSSTLVKPLRRFLGSRDDPTPTRVALIETLTMRMLQILASSGLLDLDETTVAIPIMRGGGLLVDGVKQVLTSCTLRPVMVSRVGDVPPAERKHQQLSLTWHERSGPEDLVGAHVLVLDLVVGTGNTIQTVVEEILPGRPSRLTLLALYGTPEGLEHLQGCVERWSGGSPETRLGFHVACQSGSSGEGGWAYPDPGDAGDIYGAGTDPAAITRLLMSGLPSAEIARVLAPVPVHGHGEHDRLQRFRNIFTSRTAEHLANHLLHEMPFTQDSMRFSGVHSFYVHLTYYCPVQCGGCMYTSPPPREDGLKAPGQTMTELELSRTIEFLSPLDMDEVAISGGGESFLELDKIIRFVREITARRVVLITSGFWGADAATARDYIGRIKNALDQRSRPTRLQIRLSVDEFHQRRIGLTAVSNIVSTLQEPSFSDIGVFIRSIRTEASRAVLEELASLLGGTLDASPGSEQIITDGRRIGILNKPFILRGAMKRDYSGGYDRLDRSSVPTHPGLEVMESGAPGLKGNIDIGGVISTVGSTSPANLGSVYTDTFESFQERMFRDIISRALFDEGLLFFIEIMKEIAPDIEDRTIESNDSYLYFQDEMRPAEKRLYVSLRLAQEYSARKKIDASRLPAAIRHIVDLDPEDLRHLYHSTKPDSACSKAS